VILPSSGKFVGFVKADQTTDSTTLTTSNSNN